VKFVYVKSSVAGSSGSTPVMIDMRLAISQGLLAKIPGVSKVLDIGNMSPREESPVDGRKVYKEVNDAGSSRTQKLLFREQVGRNLMLRQQLNRWMSRMVAFIALNSAI
jgi:hypothetical protein